MTLAELIETEGLSGLLDRQVDELEHVHIEWDGHDNDRRAGYIFIDFKVWDGGSVEFRGVYHPDGVCEGEHICIHCGRTLW